MQRRIGQSRQNIPLPDAVLVLPGLFVPADPYKVTVCDVFQKQDAFPRQYRFKSHLAGFQIHMGQKSLSLFVCALVFCGKIDFFPDNPRRRAAQSCQLRQSMRPHSGIVHGEGDQTLQGFAAFFIGENRVDGLSVRFQVLKRLPVRCAHIVQQRPGVVDPHQAVAVSTGEHRQQGILQRKHGVDIAVQRGKVSVRVPITVPQSQRQRAGQHDQLPEKQAASLPQPRENGLSHSPPSPLRKS